MGTKITTEERLMLLAKVQRIIWLKQYRNLDAGILKQSTRQSVLREFGIVHLEQKIGDIITGRVLYKDEKYYAIWSALNSI